MKAIFLVFLIVASVAVASAGTNVVNCYLSSWAKWRTGLGKFTIQDINPKLCTHITYAFIGLTSAGAIDPMGSTDDYPSFLALKQQNPNVKLIISMGGWNEGSTVFSEVTNDPSLCATLVSNIVNWVTSNNFDGFDLDWEYPGQRGGAASDRTAYVNFLQSLQAAFAGTGKIITAAVGADIQADAATSYDVTGMNKYLDYFNIMTYDYHASYDGVTGEDSPMYASSVDTNPNLNVNASISGWIAAGASPQKVLLGLPFYGHTFMLTNANNNGIGAPTSGAGPAGPYSQQGGMLEYLEICQALQQPGWTTVFDPTQQVPYSYNTGTSEWIGYDNVQSIQIKTQYAMANNLGGVLIWSIESDDWNNDCGGGSWPLLNAIDNTMSGQQPIQPPQTPAPSSAEAPTTAPVTSAPVTSAPSPSQPGICSANGYFATPGNCNTFYECVGNGGQYTKYPFTCPATLVFNPSTSQCDYPANVPGC